MKKFKLVFILILILPFTFVLGQENLEKSTFSSAGNITSNQNFRVVGTLGQSFAGRVENTTFINQTGFWYAASRIALDKTLDNLPGKFELYQNYPNPFNPQTSIKFNVPKDAHIKLEIYNMLGQRIAILVDEKMEPGLKVIKFEANNLASGIYVYSLKTGEIAQFKKMMLLR